MHGADETSGDTVRPLVLVASDSVGETAELVVRAAVSQFNKHSSPVDIRRIPFVTEEATVRETVLKAAAHPGPSMIVYTLIMPLLRELMACEAGAAGIPAVDIMGPMMDGLARVLKSQPRLEPGLIHRLDEEYFRRVAAVEFAVKYDDGKEPRGFLLAEVVLAGVSRTSKTPVCMYLANRRIKAANLPLVPEVEPPRELYLVRDRVVGLTIDPAHLQQIRRERLRTLGLQAPSEYDDLERIDQELRYARRVFSELGCPCIDVTSRAVEETAAEVLEALGKGGLHRGD